MAKNPHDGHRERLRQRFLREGFDTFEEHNILELALFYSVPRKDTNELAHALIEQFGSLHQVLDATFDQLTEVKGVTSICATYIKMLGQIARAYYNPEVQMVKETMNDCDKIGQYFVNQFVAITGERVYILLLDNALSVLACEQVGNEGLSSVNLDIRKIIELALKYRSEKVVLAHNHPKTPPMPSNDDVVATTFLQNALQTMNMELVDHIIVSGRHYGSLSKMNYL